MGVTIQNEPMATQRWESCIYTAEQERFLKNNLGPTMERRIRRQENRRLGPQPRPHHPPRQCHFRRPRRSEVRLGYGLSLVRNLDRRQPQI